MAAGPTGEATPQPKARPGGRARARATAAGTAARTLPREWRQAREDEVVVLHRDVAAEALLDESRSLAVRLQLHPQEAGEAPAAGGLVLPGVLHHELHLDELVGLDRGGEPGVLARRPGDLGEGRPVGEGTGPLLQGLDGGVVAEDRPDVVLVRP